MNFSIITRRNSCLRKIIKIMILNYIFTIVIVSFIKNDLLLQGDGKVFGAEGKLKREGDRAPSSAGTSGAVKTESPRRRNDLLDDDDDIPDDSFHMITQYNWEDDIIWNGDDLKHKVQDGLRYFNE